jgi:E3 ubiquitin-protein ligase RNF115/126
MTPEALNLLQSLLTRIGQPPEGNQAPPSSEPTNTAEQTRFAGGSFAFGTGGGGPPTAASFAQYVTHITLLSLLISSRSMLQQIFGGPELAHQPNNPFFDLFNVVGNPGDYVFGQAALDNIITQIMEQTAGRNAPPPASQETISSLPKTTMSQQQLGNLVSYEGNMNTYVLGR